MKLNGLQSKIPYLEIKRLLHLAAPIIAAQIMQCLNSFIDTIMAGWHSPDTLSQVAMGSSLWIPLLILSAGIFNGVSALTSHAFGAGDKRQVSALFASSIVLSLILSVFLVFFLRNASVLFPLFDVPEYLGSGISDYVNMVSYGFPLLLIFWAFRGWVEGIHLMKPAMIASLVSVLLNIPLNYIFIHGWWIVPELGAKGCGIATAISFATMPFTMLILFVYQKTFNEHGIRLSQLWDDWNLMTIQRILKIGGPVGISGFIEGSFFCVIAIMLAPLGSTSVAAHQITMNISSLIFMIPLGFNFALTVAVGRAYGANSSVDQMRRLIHSGLFLAVLFTSFSCLLLFSCRYLIPQLYTSDDAVIHLSAQLLVFAAVFQLPDGLQITIYGVLKGLQDTFVPMLIGILSYWTLGATLGYSFTFFESFGALGAKGAWIGLNIGLLATFIAYSIRMAIIFRRRTGGRFIRYSDVIA